MKLRGAIFDLDGTLLDSMYIWDELGKKYLESKGIQPEPDHAAIVNVLSLLQTAEYYQRCGVPGAVEEIMAGINEKCENFYFHEAGAKQGVKEMLDVMQSHNVKMCVATASDRYLVEAALKRNGIDHFFVDIFTCSEIGSGKDEPQIFEIALQGLGTGKSETVVFEDSLYAIQTAKKAGFYVMGVYDNSWRYDWDFIQKTANFCIDDWNQFEEWFLSRSVGMIR
jgi:beta-phosphoglucomutase-like phosphatase (HAD superfamily)